MKRRWTRLIPARGFLEGGSLQILANIKNILMTENVMDDGGQNRLIQHKQE